MFFLEKQRPYGKNKEKKSDKVFFLIQNRGEEKWNWQRFDF